MHFDCSPILVILSTRVSGQNYQFPSNFGQNPQDLVGYAPGGGTSLGVVQPSVDSRYPYSYGIESNIAAYPLYQPSNARFTHNFRDESEFASCATRSRHKNASLSEYWLVSKFSIIGSLLRGKVGEGGLWKIFRKLIS